MYSGSYKKYAPDPRLERQNYQMLCGEWDFAFADDDTENPVFDRKIIVPYTYESAASGIGDTRCHTCIWYRRTIDVKRHDGAVLLHFEGVDYHCFLYVNGKLAAEHLGGFTAFTVDVTAFVTEGDNVLSLKVLDSLDKAQLRGKQRAETESYECWYVQTTGIWKPVRLEYAGKIYVEDVAYRTTEKGDVTAEVRLSGAAKVTFTVYDGGKEVYRFRATEEKQRHVIAFSLKNAAMWSVASPHLYDVSVVAESDCADGIRSYFGFCNVVAREDGLYINGKREYQKMVLYQGYWADTMLTAPDDEALERDIDAIKQMGFNGVRVHQKVENEVFYYLCDKKGLYVWGEIPSAYEFNEKMQREYARDADLIYRQLKGHVCIVSWLLFNETWGVRDIDWDKKQQKYIENIAAELKKEDTRPLITNDGWYHLNSDILSLHEYEQDPETFGKEYRDKEYVVNGKIINENKFGKAFAEGYRYAHQPVFISEYGGIAIRGDNGWGYGEYASDENTFERRLRALTDTVRDIPYVSGFCYTQFADTQQEVNGLLHADRTPKLPTEIYRGIFSENGKEERKI